MQPSLSNSRFTWSKYVLLGLLMFTSAAGGFYFSSRGDSEETLPSGDGGLHSTVHERSTTPTFHRFALSALDVKDTVEAPSVAADAHGNVYIAWASKTGESERTVLLTRSTDGGRSFGTPAIVGKGGVYKSGGKGNGKTGGYERRATPQLALDESSVNVAWSRGEKTNMELVLATSADRARTFTPAQPIHHGEPAAPTFISMTAGTHGELACTWLSDRDGGQLPFAAVRDSSRGEFHSPLPAAKDQAGVCPCCPTAGAFATDGTLFVGFRNIHEGYRDIAVSRLRPGNQAFEGPFPVVHNTWKFDGCPHDGPSLLVLAETLHVLWMDARSGPQRCYHGWANVNTMKFEVGELCPGTPGTQGNAKMAADQAHGIHAVCEQSIGSEPESSAVDAGHHHAAPTPGKIGGRAIVYGYLAPGQSLFQRIHQLAPKAGAFQSRPALSVLPAGDLLVVWFELDATGKSVVAALVPAQPEGV